jgi:hypothetical protein
VDWDGDVIAADSENHCIRRVASDCVTPPLGLPLNLRGGGIAHVLLLMRTVMTMMMMMMMMIMMMMMMMMIMMMMMMMMMIMMLLLLMMMISPFGQLELRVPSAGAQVTIIMLYVTPKIKEKRRTAMPTTLLELLDCEQHPDLFK